jgi:hypothetical protein
LPRLAPFATVTALAAAAGGCALNGPTTVTDTNSQSHTITATRGSEVDITLQVIGAGIFDSIPAVSSPVVAFLDESQVLPAVSVGPTQLFRFTAVSPGTAIVDFLNKPQAITIEDTIVVN